MPVPDPEELAAPQDAVREPAKLELPPVVYQPRSCLRCGLVFSSSGPGNRICARCSRNQPQLGRREIDGALRPVWDSGDDAGDYRPG